MSWLLNKTYYRLRHWRWEREETKVVEYIARHMANQDVVYVHTYNGGPPVFEIRRVTLDTAGHGHLESSKPRGF